MEDIRLEATGLFLDPSELTAPAGSMREALNVRIKRQNLIEPRPGFPITALTGPSGAGWQAFSWSGEAYGVFNTKLWRDESPAVEIRRITGMTYTGGPPAVTYATTSLVMSSDTAYAEQIGRNFYVITDGGVVRVADPADDTCVYAGLPVGPPPLGYATGATTDHFAMRTVMVQTVNGQLIVGAPSAAAVFIGTGAELTIRSNQYGLLPGMRLQVYATEPVVLATPTGDEMRLVYDIELTNQQWILGAGDPTLSLTINPYLNGASLYTNETQEGIAQASYRPRIAKCMAAFKGMAFYGDLLPEYNQILEGTTGDGPSAARVMAIGSEYEQLDGTATIGSPVIQFLTTFIANDYLTGCYVSQGGIVGTAGTIIPANARIIAVSTGGVLGTDTITLDKNALSSAAVPILYVHDVLTVDGEEFINGVLSDMPNRQFGSRSDLVALVAAHTDVRLEVSSNDEDPYTLLWQSNGAAFSISYQPRLTNGTLVGLYGVSAVTSAAADADRSRVMWSKTLQPEAVPRLNFQDLGAWREPVLRMVPTRDSLFILKADGVWRITGESPETLRVEEFDRTIRLIHRRAADLYENQVWAWTSNGIVAISEAGAQRMSEPAIGSALEASQENIITLGLSAPPGGCFIAGCTNQECVLVGVPSSTATGANANAKYIYCWEGKTGAWVRWQALTNIDWRGAVEHEGDMLLVGGDGSLMYQNDDRTDAEAAVTVTLAEATQATIGALGSAGVGHRVTQGSVVAWLTEALGSAAYTTTATLTNGAATTAYPMECVVEWNASPTPGTMSHWRQMRAQMTTLSQAWRVLFGFTSERVHTLAQVWQDFSSPQTEQGVTALRMLITRAHARCARLRPRITIESAGQDWLLNGITLTFEPMRDGNRLP